LQAGQTRISSRSLAIIKILYDFRAAKPLPCYEEFGSWQLFRAAPRHLQREFFGASRALGSVRFSGRT
jgi:hypothetical protein